MIRPAQRADEVPWSSNGAVQLDAQRRDSLWCASGGRSIVHLVACVASALVFSTPGLATAAPFDDLVNNALKAAKSALDAASSAAAASKGGFLPPQAPVRTAPATNPLPASAPARVVATPPTPSPTSAVSPAQPAPASPGDWNYRVIGESGFGLGAGWSIDEVQDFGIYVEQVNACAPTRLRGGGANELFSQDLVSRIKVKRDYPQMLAQLAIVNSNAAEAPPSSSAAQSPAALRCVALLRDSFPELDRVQFTYTTFKAGALVVKTGGLKELLLDGAFDTSGQKALSPSFAPEDLVALDAGRRPPLVAAPEAPGPARISSVSTGKPLPGLKPLGKALRSPFSIGAYEAVAVKSDGTVEVRSFDFPNAFNPFQAKVGAGRVMPALRDVVGVRAQATFENIRIGTISAARDRSGNWMGWRTGAQPAPIAFDAHLATLGMNELAAPSGPAIVNFSGGRSAIWQLYEDGSVLMASERGVLPGTFEANWQKEHKFTGVAKIVATPGPSGSFRALFLKDDGTVWANGARFYQGWLQGEGNANEKRMSPMADAKLSPVRLKALSHVRDIAAYWPSTSIGHGAALLEDGTVVSFRLDPRAPDEAVANLPITRAARVTKARAIAAGAWGVGAVDAEGNVWVWGSNPEVMREDRRPAMGFRGGGAPAATADEPTMVPGLTEVLQIDFSSAFAGALKNDGTVWIWNDEAPIKIFDGVKLEP